MNSKQPAPGIGKSRILYNFLLYYTETHTQKQALFGGSERKNEKEKAHHTESNQNEPIARLQIILRCATSCKKSVCFFVCLFSSIRFDSIRYSVVYAHGLMQCLSFCLSCLFSFKSSSSSSGYSSYSSRFLICVLIALIRSRMVRTVYTQVNRLRSLLRSYASWYMSWFFLSFFD